MFTDPVCLRRVGAGDTGRVVLLAGRPVVGAAADLLGKVERHVDVVEADAHMLGPDELSVVADVLDQAVGRAVVVAEEDAEAGDPDDATGGSTRQGSVETSIASMVVRWAECEQSTIIPTRFISWTTARPNSVSPVSTSWQPPPASLLRL